MSGKPTTPAQHGQGTLPRLDARDWPEFQPGWVWMTGGGPGDPGLITLHALNAQQGLRVLRLKGGDPFVFGRGGEEAQTLVKAGIRLRVIPGISAGIGGLAYAGIPVTHRDVNQSVTFLSGHDRTGLMPSAIDWQGLGSSAQVIVMYMAIKHMPDICARLIAAGRAPDEPVAIVQNATRDDMRVLETTLANAPQDITDSGIGAPSIVCVGRVVLMRQCLDWLGQMAGEPVRDEDPLGVRTMSDTA
jgi:uroporphyrin-III C-methyltransferase